MPANRRLHRIFQPDGRALIVAMDHGLLDGPCPGLEDPGKTVHAVVAGGADAILTSYGVAMRFAQALAPVGLILRLDGGSTRLGSYAGPGASFYGVEAALRLGADAVAVSAFPGASSEVEDLRRLAETVEAAHAWGLPVMAEVVPGGFDSPPELRTAENVAVAVRIAAELGADFVKTPYAPGFEQVVQGCYVPVVILGGARRGNEEAMLQTIRDAVHAGAAGVAIGRNIFQAPDPRAMTAAVAAVIHGVRSAEEVP